MRWAERTVSLGVLGLGLATVAAAPAAATAGAAALVASPESGWPQWRGPRRDGISTESGLLQAWPEGGPKVLWRAEGLGLGYSSPVISGERLFITGDVGAELHVFALDLAGQRQWETAVGQSWRANFPGARGSCAYAAGKVYVQNAHGVLSCLDAVTGAVLWQVDALARFGGTANTWGLAEGPLVDGDRVVTTPGGTGAFMAALDRNTGATVWASPPLPDPKAEGTGYGSPILVRLGDRRLLVNLSQRSIVGVDADRGTLLWRYEKPTQYNANCATPVLVGNGIFHTSPTKSGGVLLGLVPEADGLRVEKLWTCPTDNISGGAVCVDGWIYSSGQQNGGWACIDAKTGQTAYTSTALAQGAVLYADRRLYCLAEDGVAALVEPGPAGHRIVSRFNLAPPGKHDAWAHPVVLDRRLYLRYHGALTCYDIAAP